VIASIGSPRSGWVAGLCLETISNLYYKSGRLRGGISTGEDLPWQKGGLRCFIIVKTKDKGLWGQVLIVDISIWPRFPGRNPEGPETERNAPFADYPTKRVIFEIYKEMRAGTRTGTRYQTLSERRWVCQSEGGVSQCKRRASQTECSS
jgi:hypothetical protein